MQGGPRRRPSTERPRHAEIVTAILSSAGMTWFTLLGFMGLYLLIGLLYLLLFLRIVWAGAGDGHAGGAYGATEPEAAS